MKSFHVYRYNDRVALSIPPGGGNGNGATHYLSSEQALKLAKALKKAGKDIAKVDFLTSGLPEFKMNI